MPSNVYQITNAKYMGPFYGQNIKGPYINVMLNWCSTSKSLFATWAILFSATISNPACKKSSTLILICYLIPLVPLHLVGDTWSLLPNFFRGLCVHLWCMYDILFIHLAVMLLMCQIKHILAWLTKCTHASKRPGVFDFRHVVKTKWCT